MAKEATNGLLRTLADIPGSRSKTEESVRFEVSAIQDAMDQIKRLQGTGQLTINFHNGHPNGLAEWKSLQREKT